MYIELFADFSDKILHKAFYVSLFITIHVSARLLQYRMYQVRSSSSGQPLNFRLCDTRGIEETQNTDANDIAYLLEGNVPEGYQVCICI